MLDKFWLISLDMNWKCNSMEREQFFVGVGLSSYTATGVLHRGLSGVTEVYWSVTEAYWGVTEAYWGEKGAY